MCYPLMVMGSCMGKSDLVQCHYALLGVMCGEACEEETALYSLMVEGRKDSQ